jgi:prevent-host-death family protein
MATMTTVAPTRTVNIHEAKTHLSKLLARVEAGEEIVVARDGRPIAKIVRLSERPRRRKPGFLKGRIHMSDDFDDPLPDDIQKAFEGR